MKKVLFLLTIVVFLSLNNSCIDKSINSPKYIFYFIGDGMGIQQVQAAQVYIDSILKDTISISFSKFPVRNFITTYAANRYITCSAAAGTALSTGSKTSISTLGLSANRKDTLWSIAKKFMDYGYKVGLVTSVSIDHATPAAFYAHQPERGGYYPIALDLIKSGYHFFASGGFKDPYANKELSPVKSIYELGRNWGVGFTSNPDSLVILKKSFQSIVFNAANPAPGNTLQFEIDRKETDLSLTDLTEMAINNLENPKGFFLMVEGGKIDWACHSNDGATAIHEVISFSKAVGQAIDFYRQHPNETLIIVTADHETGGFSIGNSPNGYDIHFNYLSKQIISKEQLEILIKQLARNKQKPSFDEIYKIIKEKTGLCTSGFEITDSELKSIKDAYFSTFGDNKSKSSLRQSEYSESENVLADVVINLLNTKAGIGWTSTSHTGTPVPLYVIGQGQELFQGDIDNTDIPKLIEKISFSM